jgi:hypothetical protein
MGLLSAFIGPSDFQLKFQKAHSLHWFLTIQKITSIQYTFGNSQVKNSFLSSKIVFDFEHNCIQLEGAMVAELFDYLSLLKIISHKFIDGELVFFISSSKDNGIIMKCCVKRDCLFFEATSKYWFASLESQNVQLSINPKTD